MSDGECRENWFIDSQGLEWTSVPACNIVPLGWDFVEGFTFLCGHTIKCARIPGNCVTFWTLRECLCPTSQNTRSFVRSARGPHHLERVACILYSTCAPWRCGLRRQTAGRVLRQVFALFLCSTASFYKMSKSLVSNNSGICRYKLADWRAFVNKPGTYWGVFWNYIQKCCI
jgi:hypothetical protein